MTIKWGGIELLEGTGLKKIGATKGEIWLTTGSNTGEVGSSSTIYSGGSFVGIGQTASSAVNIFWQIDENNWKQLRITGLQRH